MTDTPTETPIILGKEAHRRSFVKAVSWRILGSIDTFLISWLVTGHPVIAATISAIEIITKIILYYFHERIWGKVRWGKKA